MDASAFATAKALWMHGQVVIAPSHLLVMLTQIAMVMVTHPTRTRPTAACANALKNGLERTAPFLQFVMQLTTAAVTAQPQTWMLQMVVSAHATRGGLIMIAPFLLPVMPSRTAVVMASQRILTRPMAVSASAGEVTLVWTAPFHHLAKQREIVPGMEAPQTRTGQTAVIASAQVRARQMRGLGSCAQERDAFSATFRHHVMVIEIAVVMEPPVTKTRSMAACAAAWTGGLAKTAAYHLLAAH